MGHTIFEKSQGDLLNLVMETVEESGILLLKVIGHPVYVCFQRLLLLKDNASNLY